MVQYKTVPSFTFCVSTVNETVLPSLTEVVFAVRVYDGDNDVSLAMIKLEFATIVPDIEFFLSCT